MKSEFCAVPEAAGRIVDPGPGGKSRPSVAVPASPYSSSIPPGGREEAFDQPAALEINRARLEHVFSLGIPLAGRTVLDVGCGVGHLGQSLVRAGCRVLCVDGREENIRALTKRYPGMPAQVFDVESEEIRKLGTFDVVFCYGLLYHLENPMQALRNLSALCGGVLLLETVITDGELPVLQIADETRSWNQALRGVGCRPSPAYVGMALSRIGFPHLYAPRAVPDHPDFRFERKNDLAYSRDGHLLRCVFVAAREPLELTTLLPVGPGSSENRCDEKR